MSNSSASDGAFSDRFKAWMTEWDDVRLRRVMLTVLGVMSGILVTLFSSIVACSVFFYLFPNNVYLDMADTEQALELMKTVPAGDFIVELLAWVVAVALGAYTAERIAKRGGYPAWLVGIVFYFFPYPATRPFEGSGVVATFVGIPHPLWVVLISIPLIALAAYGAGFAAFSVNAGRLSRTRTRKASRKVRRPTSVVPARETQVAEATSEMTDDMTSMDGTGTGRIED